MRELVMQLNASTQRPVSERSAHLEVGILRTSADDKTHPPGDSVAPTDVEHVVVNLTTGILRKLEQLKGVDHADLIATGNQMAIASLSRHLVAVGQKICRVVEMSVAEPARDGDSRHRADRLHDVEHRGIGKPRNVSDAGTAAAKLVSTRNTSTETTDSGRQSQPRDAAKGSDFERTVGQVVEGIAQSRLSGSPAGDGVEAGRLQLFGGVRVGIKRSAAQILEKQITLGPELLHVDGTQHATNRVKAVGADLVARVGVSRFTDLQRGRDETAARAAQVETGFVKARDGGGFRTQYRHVLTKGRRRSGRLRLRLSAGLRSRAQPDPENQHCQSDYSHSRHSFHVFYLPGPTARFESQHESMFTGRQLCPLAATDSSGRSVPL